jgi:pimeloyl-ACP methyl ester carboxylesterase
MKALAAVVLAALLCGYLTLCLLFYVGQWQLVLHPARNPGPLKIPGTPAELIRFAPDESGVPQLTGWWIPAVSGARYPHTTLLYLPGGDGSAIDQAALLEALHRLGANVFAIDYRGYGQSATTHPSQANMTSDAESAWRYLRLSLGLAEQEIVPYGSGVGTSLASQLALDHRGITAVILESPRADLLAVLTHDARTNFLPAKLLFHENFPLAAKLASLRTPKLLLAPDPLPAAFITASDPKIAVALGSAASRTLSSQPGYLPSLSRFLDQYASAVGQSAIPAPTLSK